ncbi:MAG: hypothetical protein Q4G40_03535 [Brachybacterium sp.]|nr:hypothetical protein [Brachybacterium sp.]
MTTFAVFPLRFSDDPAAMIEFLRLLGLRPAVTTEGDSFATLVAPGGGRVKGLSGGGGATRAAAGETQLCLAVEDTDSAAETLRAAGLEVRVWDETYGRQGLVIGPHGEGIALNEEQKDLYGYVGHDPAASGDQHDLTVSAVRASAEGTERQADVAFFGAAGFDPVGPGDEWWQALTAPGAGVIGLHAPSGAGEEISRATGTEFGDIALVRLGAETDEDLEHLSARLTAAGHVARVVEEDVRSVHVTDPDGQHLEIHPRSR